MTTQVNTPATAIAVELGQGIPDPTGDAIHRAFTEQLDKHHRHDLRLHVRIIDGHDPDTDRPVLGRVLVDGRDEIHIEAATADEAVEALADRLGAWLHAGR